MISLTVYNQQGKEVGNTELSERVFGLKWSPALVKQAVDAESANARVPVAHVKGRGEVSGGGKKPWRQKGTGRARHGSIRSPIWVGGGVTHGPTKDKIFSKKINKTMRRKALLVALSQKVRDNEVIILDTLSFANPKTKEAVAAFKALGGIAEFTKIGMKGGKAVVMLPTHDTAAVRAMRNLPYVFSQEARNADVQTVLTHKYIVIPKESLEVLEHTFAK